MISMERISEFHKRGVKSQGNGSSKEIMHSRERQVQGKSVPREKVQGFRTRGVPRKMMLEFEEMEGPRKYNAYIPGKGTFQRKFV
jgi:hypothetical protein